MTTALLSLLKKYWPLLAYTAIIAFASYSLGDGRCHAAWTQEKLGNALAETAAKDAKVKLGADKSGEYQAGAADARKKTHEVNRRLENEIAQRDAAYRCTVPAASVQLYEEVRTGGSASASRLDTAMR